MDQVKGLPKTNINFKIHITHPIQQENPTINPRENDWPCGTGVLRGRKTANNIDDSIALRSNQ
jgi:hypothetical protein